jgi:hypothetical protein
LLHQESAKLGEHFHSFLPLFFFYLFLSP